MKNRIGLLVILIIVGVVISLIVYQPADAPVLGDETIVLRAPDGREVVMAVEIADSETERAQGLMGRENLPAGTGMLFVYDASFELGFWMKNTVIPLDILFFDNNGVFVSRTTMDPCFVEPCATYSSNGSARYALEVNRGESQTAAVGTGWILWRPTQD